MNNIKKYFFLPALVLFFILNSVSCSSEDKHEQVSTKLMPTPTINSVDPERGEEGDLVTITGINFSTDATNIKVEFSGVEADEISFSSVVQISVKVPVGATTGNISVTIANQTVKGPVFTVEATGEGGGGAGAGGGGAVEETPINFKIAFFGDSGIGAEADAVLNLVKSEGAQAVVHAGDLNYSEIPQDFEDNINGILGENFPYFFSVGNHDDAVWNGPNGYQQFLKARFNRLGISWNGQLGVLASFSFKGIYFVVSAPDEFSITASAAGDHVRRELEKNNSVWKISFWHKNQRLMQIGGKGDEAGWDVYEESRKGGAIIATGHEHSYSRTYEMSNFKTQTVSSKDTVHLVTDDPSTSSLDEGRSFAFVSGLGGKSIRENENNLDKKPWWANVYHSNNGGQYGALFGEFNYGGDTSLARFYFKDIKGQVRDIFFVRSDN